MGKSEKPKKASRARSTGGQASGTTFDCVRFDQGGQTLVIFVASAKQIWDMVKVNRREEDKEDGYQRSLSKSRVAKLARFIGAGNMVPNSVLISFDEGDISKDGKKFTVPAGDDVGWVIDGQHRLAGAHESTRDIVLPIVGLIGLHEQGQIDCFVTINREQKGVPSSLYLDLLKYLPRKTEAEQVKERAADLANTLKREDDSPFYGRIVVATSPRPGQLSLVNFVRMVSPLIKPSGRLSSYTFEESVGVLGNYYIALEQAFPKEYRRQDSIFFRTLGFGALINLLPTFFDITLQRASGSFAVADAVGTFALVSDFDFGGWHQMGTGSAAENQASADIRAELIEASQLDGNGETRLKL